MATVIGVRFRAKGRMYYFSPLNYEFQQNDKVIVETARGIELGYVVIARREVPEEKIVQPLKPIMRPATPEDEMIAEANRQKEAEAMEICKEKIRKHNLEMKLIDCVFTFDGNKILFYFTADGRVDFRELVKDLASVFRTRIELRQIGVRDETRMMGGLGICGRVLCCNSYLNDFIPVSVKMAKEQNLSLNPTKISGNCGRLMCCLKYEEEAYEYLNSTLPEVGDTVKTSDGLTGQVTAVTVLKQLVKVLVSVDEQSGEEKEVREYPVSELQFKPRKKNRRNDMDEGLRELELLEKKEGRHARD